MIKMGLQNKKGIDDPAGKQTTLLDREFKTSSCGNANTQPCVVVLLLKQPIKFFLLTGHKDHSVWFSFCCFSDEWKLQSFL